jgi:S-adenosylmethionine synthetase
MGSKLLNCIGDDAYKASATEQAKAIRSEAENWALTQTAIMVAQKLVDDTITDMQAGIANRRYTLAKEILEQAKQTWPKEKEFVDEVMAEAVHAADYSTVTGVIAESEAHASSAVLANRQRRGSTCMK